MRDTHVELSLIPIHDAAQRNQDLKRKTPARLQKLNTIAQHSTPFTWKRNSQNVQNRKPSANQGSGLERQVQQNLQSKGWVLPSNRNPKLLYDLIAPVSTYRNRIAAEATIFF
jgi:hypothetical protein